MAVIELSTGALITQPKVTSSVLNSDSDLNALTLAAGSPSGPIGILFPSFTDGRGFSLARLLRERLGFQGEVRALGALLPDHALFLLRSGFDTAEIDDASDIDTWRTSLSSIRHNYQPAARNPRPLRRSAGAQLAGDLNHALAETDDIVERVQLITGAISGRIAFSTGFGLEDQALLHAVSYSTVKKSGADIDVFTIDTGRLFLEVLETAELSQRRYRTPIRFVGPDAFEVEELVAEDGVYGFRQSIENRMMCCEIRKIRPLNGALRGAHAWITGLRRDQSEARMAVPLARWDNDRELIKVNPIADWSDDRLDRYIDTNDIPINSLHALGFVSVGCAPCTRAIELGEEPRAGRWWWEGEDSKECGLHTL